MHNEVTQQIHYCAVWFRTDDLKVSQVQKYSHLVSKLKLNRSDVSETENVVVKQLSE